MCLSACGAISGGLGEERAAPGVTGRSEPLGLGSGVPSAARALRVPASEPHRPVCTPLRDHCCSATEATRCTGPCLSLAPATVVTVLRQRLLGAQCYRPASGFSRAGGEGGRGPCRQHSADAGSPPRASSIGSAASREVTEPNQSCRRGRFISRSRVSAASHQHHNKTTSSKDMLYL